MTKYELNSSVMMKDTLLKLFQLEWAMEQIIQCSVTTKKGGEEFIDGNELRKMYGELFTATNELRRIFHVCENKLENKRAGITCSTDLNTVKLITKFINK